MRTWWHILGREVFRLLITSISFCLIYYPFSPKFAKTIAKLQPSAFAEMATVLVFIMGGLALLRASWPQLRKISDKLLESFQKNPIAWILGILLVFSVRWHRHTGDDLRYICHAMSEYTQDYTDKETMIVKSKLNVIRKKSRRGEKDEIESLSENIQSIINIIVEDYKSREHRIFRLHEELLKSNTLDGREYAENYFLVRDIQDICERRQTSSEIADDL